MRKIFPLPEHIVAKIAAGEVIERPAYAVKELIENAIDAKADSITITIENAGLKKIIVSDTGEGMDKEDLIESIKPHTTSKIFSEDMLTGIATLGFRGEALSSIAAISTMSIKSRRADTLWGTMITATKQRVTDIEPVGMPIGTTVTIDNLFSTVPARKKFLKSQKTEFRHILDIIIQYAISFPQISFRLWHNKRNIINLPKTNVIIDRLSAILGKDLLQNLLPLSYEDAYVTIHGFVAKPHITASTSSKQFLFVNKRAVSDKLLSLAVKESYGNLLDVHTHPIVIVFLTLPCEIVDVNIHPRKEYVSFTDNKLIFDAVKNAVTTTLTEHNISFSNIPWRIQGLTNSFAGKTLRESILPWDIPKEQTEHITQIHSVYLMMQTRRGIIIIDQHAAHERILYEHFKRIFTNRSKTRESYTLSPPYEFTASISDSVLLEEHIPIFTQLGFSLIHIKTSLFCLRAVPSLLRDRNYAALIRELCDDLREEGGIKDIDSATTRMLSFLACRDAIKRGDVVTPRQAKELIETLYKTPNNSSCAHGRPTYWEISLKELNSKFKRT